MYKEISKEYQTVIQMTCKLLTLNEHQGMCQLLVSQNQIP